MKARRCAKFNKNKHCIRYKKVDVVTAKGIRQGSAYFKGDRIKGGNWSKKRWETAKAKDRARIGKKYEVWERIKRMRWK